MEGMPSSGVLLIQLFLSVCLVDFFYFLKHVHLRLLAKHPLLAQQTCFRPVHVVIPLIRARMAVNALKRSTAEVSNVNANATIMEIDVNFDYRNSSTMMIDKQNSVTLMDENMQMDGIG